MEINPNNPKTCIGLFGLISMLLGAGFGIYLTFIKLFYQVSIGNRPLLILAVLLFLAGIQLLSFGVLAELVMRTYHESQKRPIYRVREVIGEKSK